MGQTCRKIKTDYVRYTKLLNGIKTSSYDAVVLAEGKGSHKNWLSGRTDLQFNLNNTGHLAVRQSRSLNIDYGFQVFVNDIERPIFRFDADGAIHYNRHDETIPLTEREIKTPHFHRYDKEGNEYAYRTPALIEHELEVQADIQIGMDYFCEENYIQSKLGKSLKIRHQAEIFPSEVSHDVHKGVTFP